MNTTRRLTWMLVVAVGLFGVTAGLMGSHFARSVSAQAPETDSVILPGFVGSEELIAGPDAAFVSKAGRFIYDANWRQRLSAQCNVLGELRDCDGNLVVKVGTDQPDWPGWLQLNSKWVRAFGDLTLLPSECGVHLYVFNPSQNIGIVSDPCSATKPTATPIGGGGGGTPTRTCTGSSVTSVYNIRAGGDDVVWSPQRGLERTGTILSLGGNQLFHPIVGLRFSGVAMTRNAKVFSARVKFSPAASSGIAVDQRVFGVNMGNLSSWGSTTPGNAPRTSANTLWEIRNQWNGSSACGVVNTNDIGGPLQNIVDRTDWNAGNALGVIFDWEGPFAEASQRPVWSFEHGCPPQLTVTWCPAVITTGPTSTPIPGVATATKPSAGTFPTATTGPTSTRPTPTGIDPSPTFTAGPVLPTKTPVPGDSTETATSTPPDTASSTPTNEPTATDAPTATSTATPTQSPSTTDPSPTPTPCDNPYDVNGDGVIDINDIDLILAAFGSTPSSPNWNPDADVNGDGVVDILDYLIVREHFGPACPQKGVSTPTAS